MTTLLLLVASCTAGVLLGAIFFWGLWTTLKRLGRARSTAVLLLGSLVLRFGLVLGGFYLLARYAGWEHVLAAALGFTLSRILVVYRLQAHAVTREPGT